MQIHALTFVILIAGIMQGCQKSELDGILFVPVKGTVTMDGQPLPGCIVEFSPQIVETNTQGLGGSGAQGQTNDEGKFEMRTNRTFGVQPGSYEVRITKIPEAQNPDLPSTFHRKENLPARYNERSELSLEVTDQGDENVTFELTSGK